MLWHLATAAVTTIGLAIVVHRAGRAPAYSVGDGPGPACVLPERRCTTACDELDEMPLGGVGYLDRRIEEETIPETSTSFVRRDLMMLVHYAAAKVACKARDWKTGNGGPIVLGDGSEIDGSTPGSVWGMPRHPAHSHVDGLAIDIAYYQRGTVDNSLRPVCPHFTQRREQWHCTAAPALLDASRTALFVGALLEDEQVRVIGIDGLVAQPVLAAFDELCAHGWIDRDACTRRRRIRFERTNTGAGWFYGHHNHLHLALTRPP
jgi:hypothetical protein